VNRMDFQLLADVRIEESRALLNLPAPMPDGAYYLAGYAVECALKACICLKYAQYDWPEKKFVADSHTHAVLDLVRLAGFADQRVADAASDLAFAENWQIVKDWGEHTRYERHSLVKARRMFDAVDNNANGVLSWIKARW
jgi:hypothetical protein